MSFPRSNAPGRNAKRGRPGVCGHVTPPICCRCVLRVCCVVYAQRWPGLADGAGWCDGWHGLGWFVCVDGLQCAKGYSCAGCYAVNVFVCCLDGVRVCVYVCGGAVYVANVYSCCVGGWGAGCCALDNLTIRSNNTKTNRKTNRKTCQKRIGKPIRKS